MSTRSRIRNFISKYSARSILERFERLISYIRTSIENTGNSFYKILLILLLLILIGIKKIGLFLKKIIDEIARIFKAIWELIINIWDNIIWLFETIWDFLINVWDKFIKFLKYIYENLIELMNLIWQFIRKIFFLTVIEEIGFYFKKLKDFSMELKENLSIIVQKLQEYSEFLSRKFYDKNLSYSSSITKNYLNLIGNAIFWFFTSTIWGILSIIMVAILLLGTLIGIPVLHQYIRNNIIGNNEE